MTSLQPGSVRDAIIECLSNSRRPMAVAEIRGRVNEQLGVEVPQSSVRSYLRLNTPSKFTRTDRGTYKIRR